MNQNREERTVLVGVGNLVTEKMIEESDYCMFVCKCETPNEETLKKIAIAKEKGKKIILLVREGSTANHDPSIAMYSKFSYKNDDHRTMVVEDILDRIKEKRL